MQKSYKVFSIGFILFLGVFISTLVFQGQSIRKNKNTYKSNEKKVLTRMPDFKPMEVQSLPNFRHVVINFPRHFVAINQSNGFSGLKLKSKIDEIGLEDFVVIDTKEVLLILPRDKSDSISKIRKELAKKDLDSYL